MDDILIQSQNIGETTYLPADKIDIDDCLRHGTLNERTVMLLRRNQQLGEASPASFRVAVARRPHGSPWPPRGFTEAYLLERGLISADEIPGAPERPRAEPKKPAQPAPVQVTSTVLKDDKIPVGPYFLQPKKMGNFTFYDAADANGLLLRPKAFRNTKDGTDWLLALSTEKAGAATSEQSPAEIEHGGDIQSGTAGGAGQDPSTDR